jgi:CRISPR-associated endonuclease/helicase Cas3
MLPKGFRHEMLSTQIVEHRYDELVKEGNVDRDLLLHLIAAHHGYARPFAPVVIDDADDETRSIEVNGIAVTPEQRSNWIPSHRLDSGVAERFWKLTRDHGWWGLAWLETILRLADQQASAAEQEGTNHE